MNTRSKPVHLKYAFHFGAKTEVEIEIFGESLFTYYCGWELQNLIKINAWGTNEEFNKLLRESEEGLAHYRCINLKIEGKPFFFIIPYYFRVYVESLQSVDKIKIVFVHSGTQVMNRTLTEPASFWASPDKCNFRVGKVYKTKDNDLAFAIMNRNGRVFTIVKGVLDLAIFCSRGIENWLTTYKVKKEIKKETKKEK